MDEVKHTPEYYANADIDLFCRINGVNVHMASMGRFVPYEVERSLPKLYEQVSEIEMIEWKGKKGVWFNEELLKSWLDIEDPRKIARYLYSFVVMARKGFYSFAPITVDPTDKDYFLMAKPVTYVDRKLEGIVEKKIGWLSMNGIRSFDSLPLLEMMERF